MKSAIVKPIPARTPLAPSTLHDTPPGSFARAARTASQLNSTIPTGLPTTSPTGTFPVTLQGNVDEGLLGQAKVSLYRAIAPADPAHYVRGQYDGYLSIDGVAPGSTTETYTALRLEIDNWRWSGVPFFIRAGKRLPVTQPEVRLVFKHPPRLGFAQLERRPDPNQLVIKLDPSPGVRIVLDARRADRGMSPGEVLFDAEFAEQGGEGPTPYEVLLHAALVGASIRFTRQDAVEEQWRVMQPLLDTPPPVHPYAPGTWGPEAADELLAGRGRWHAPWIAA